MKQYLDLLSEILEHGTKKQNRTGVPTYALFGRQLHYDLQQGFPLLTTKKIHIKSVVHELIWFLRGDTNVKYLHEHGVTIWDEWADENGDLGPIYGSQWRNWKDADGNSHDQITNMVELLKNDPNSRRNILSSWNVGEISKMRLMPCHVLCQTYVADNKLSLQLYQRSADYFLGVPFNLASYALLTHMLAHVCNYEPGHFVHTFGDVHLYENHLEQAKKQLSRTPKSLPKLTLNPEISNIFDFKYEDIVIENYDPHPRIPAPVAV